MKMIVNLQRVEERAYLILYARWRRSSLIIAEQCRQTAVALGMRKHSVRSLAYQVDNLRSVGSNPASKILDIVKRLVVCPLHPLAREKGDRNAGITKRLFIILHKQVNLRGALSGTNQGIKHRIVE